jgi:NhaP-type Na+/H+ or K+/H+ antiporter
MSFAWITVVVGVLLVSMALSGSVLRRLPLSGSILYLAVGIALGGYGARLLDVDFVADSAILERVTEIAVLVSLFTAGLKLRPRIGDDRWSLPLRLASLSMLLTVGLVTAIGVFVVHLPLGAAVLLGAVIAPTDPVLASDVQVAHPGDRDRLRFGLTGEAGLNDGTAFPFVMLGLGLLGLHPVGPFFVRWLLVDVIWAIAAGVAVGAILGTVVGRVVIYLRSRHHEAVGLDEFLTLGLIALAYGVAILVRGYGFLAVFAAGHALRRIEVQTTRAAEPPELVPLQGTASVIELATAPDRAPAYMAQAVLSFNEQLERIAEVVLVITVGATLRRTHLVPEALVFVLLLLLLVRPIAVVLGLVGSHTPTPRTALISWFGIRGIGSLYYLSFALQHGVAGPLADRLVTLTLVTVAASILVHGISVTPLMQRYERRRPRFSTPPTVSA